jgi:hypothetical protein
MGVWLQRPDLEGSPYGYASGYRREKNAFGVELHLATTRIGTEGRINRPYVVAHCEILMGPMAAPISHRQMKW